MKDLIVTAKDPERSKNILVFFEVLSNINKLDNKVQCEMGLDQISRSKVLRN